MPFIHHRSKESDYELLSQAAESLYGGDDEEAGQQHRVRFVVPAPRPKRHGLCLTAVASVMLVVFALTLARSYYLLTPTYSLTQYYTPTAASAASNDPLSQPALAHNEAHDLSMNSTTCAANFPAFYAQLKANEEHWKLKGGITQALVDRVERTGKAKTKSRIIIKDGQLFIRSYRPDQQSRTKSLFHLIHSALVANPTSADGRVPDVDLALSAEDKGLIEQPGWVLEQRSDAGAGQWLLPDFSFASWPEVGVPSMSEVLREAAKVDSQYSWSKKDPRVYFRGDHNSTAELDLFDRVKVVGAEKWADVKRTSEKNKTEAPVWEHCEKRYLILPDGTSHVRESHVFSCRSAVIHPKLHWRTHWHGALINNNSSPNQNAIELAGPLFKGLEELMRTLQSDDIEASSSTELSTGEQVAASAHRILAGRYLTPAATACYIRAALRSYATSMKGEMVLKPGGGVALGAGLGEEWKGKVHGDVAYETFVALGQPAWPTKA